MNRREFVEKRAAFAENSIDELINLLEIEDLQTRFFAEINLRDATDTWLDFQPASSPQARAKAIANWRDWWKAQTGKFKKKWRNHHL